MSSTASTSRKAKSSAASPVPAVTDLSCLGAPPLIPGETASDYQELLAAVTNVMKPVDFLETMWTRDIVDLQWDIIRFRRIKADFIAYRYEKGKTAYLKAFQLEPDLKELNGDIASIVAVNIDTLHRIDHMVMTMEARRNAAYREAERHRIGLGERLRHAAQQIEDVEFREVKDAAPGEQERAA